MPFSFSSINWDFLLDFADSLAAKTETKIDDLLVDLLRVAKDSEVIRDWLAGQVDYADSQPAGTLSLVAEPPEEVIEALRQGGIFKTARDAGEIVSTIKSLLPMLVQLLQFFRSISK